MRTYLIALAIVCMATGCKSLQTTPSFDELTTEYFNDYLELNPLSATSNGIPGYNDKLVLEMTQEYRTKKHAFYNKYQQMLLTVPFNSLTDEQKISYKIIEWETEIGKKMLQTDLHLLPVDHFNSLHLRMAMLASGTNVQPFRTVKDYNDFSTRMELYSVWLDSARVAMKAGISKNIVLPRTLIMKMIPQFESMINDTPEKHIFYAAINQMPAHFQEKERNQIASKYATIIREKLNPKLSEMLHFLKTEYVAAGRTTDGIGALPNGQAAYRAMVQWHTSTDMTPEQIHELGLREVARLQSEMELVKKQVGFDGTIREFFEHVRTKRELMPFTSPEQVIANFNAIHERIRPNVDKLFSLQPKMQFEVRRTEAFREETAAAQYVAGNLDGSRPGIFYVPIPDVTSYNTYGDEDLFLHEAIPGHHFQIALQIENEVLPEFRKYGWFGAYGEGWALYTESLGKELGLYTDPYQYFGMLGGEMHRAIRLVVDTGIHSKGWTREQAIQYSTDNEAESEASIISEIERYMAMPGQALSYKIGQITILDLRKKAEEQLGNKFDIRKFHEQLLESGGMPLELLKSKITAWIDRQSDISR